MAIKVLKKSNGITADVNITADACYIFLDVQTGRLLTEGVIDIEYSCRMEKEDRDNVNLKPFKLLKDDGTRVVNITGFTPTQVINQDNYAEQCKIAFVEEFGWTASDVTIEDEIAE
jgi:hypothetical protein